MHVGRMIRRLSSSAARAQLATPSVVATLPTVVALPAASTVVSTTAALPSSIIDERVQLIPTVHSMEQCREARFKDYWKLSKGPLSVWVAISAFPGFLISVPWPVDPVVASSVLIGTGLTSACAQTLNQIIEKDRDALMVRTRMRPLPTGHLTIDEAKKFSALTGSLGCLTLWLGTGSVLPAVIAGSTAALYAGVYTPMKVKSEYNTHVGAIVGSMPVLIGFSAAGVGLTTCASPWVLFTLQTLWQFPHFYALAWLFKDDYTRGGYNMTPMRDPTGGMTAKICLPYLAGLGLLPLATSALDITSYMFAISGSVPNFLWVYLGWYPFYKNPTRESARNFFLHSLWYLIAMYGAFVLHAKEDGVVCQVDDWKTAFKCRLIEACPHEWFSKDWIVPDSLCPVPHHHGSHQKTEPTALDDSNVACATDIA